MKKNEEKNITTNRKAFHDYTILERIEAGIELKGTEVKSLRAGHGSLKESYAKIVNGEIFLIKSHIPLYEHGGFDNHKPERDRKLLLHKKEIRRLKRNVDIKGATLIPLKMYFNNMGKVKIELGLAKGKRQYDKRAALAARDAKREIDRLRKDSY